jgi:3-oxoacyl-[acyl-carrier protein] reductase
MTGMRGRAAVVTGAASGIGKATALELAGRGARVAALDLDEDGLGLTLAQLGEGGRAITVDVTSEESVQRAVAEASAALGPISLLANCAGIPDDGGPLEQVTADSWHQVLAVNATGPFLMCRAVIPQMLELRAGAIVNVASLAAVTGKAGGVAYTAAKHAVVGLTKRMAVEYAGRGVHVNAVLPGFVETPMSTPWKSFVDPLVEATPAGRWCQPDEIAKLICYLLSDDASYINGAAYLIDGGAALG